MVIAEFNSSRTERRKRYRNSSRVDDRETAADCVRDAEEQALERLRHATVNQMAVARP